MQCVNHAKFGQHWRPRGGSQSLLMLKFCRKLHRKQKLLGGNCHHEQSLMSLIPFDGTCWPWAIGSNYVKHSVKVVGCAVGLRNHRRELLAKAWRIESTNAFLLKCLYPLSCPGNHEHALSVGRQLWRTAKYPPFLVSLIGEALLGVHSLS